MPRRIKRPKDHEELMDKLINKDSGIFNTYKDAMMFAACLGYHHNKRVPFPTSAEAILFSVFSGAFDEALWNMLAISVTDDLDILVSSEEGYDRRLTIFEEYANGGLEILDDMVIKREGLNMDNFLALIQKADDSGGGGRSILDEIWDPVFE